MELLEGGVIIRGKNLYVIFVCSILFAAYLPEVGTAEGEIDTESNLVVVNTGVEGTRPIVDRNIIVFSDPSWWDPPMTVFYHDITTQTTYNTGVLGEHWGVDNPYIAILTREWMFGDLNGDGDDSDNMLSFYNTNTGEHTVVAEETRQLCWPCADNGRIVYALSERDEFKDFNADGDMDDICGFYYDVATKESTYFADAFYTTVYGDCIVYWNFGELYYHDITANTSNYIGFRSLYPQISVGKWKVDGDIIAMQVHEGGSSGEDLNGDGDFYDFFSAYYDMADGILKIITEIEGYFADISRGKILIDTWAAPHRYHIYDIETGHLTDLGNYSCYKSCMEGDIIVGNDWSGIVIPGPPYPTGIPNVMIYDITTDELVNTNIIGHLDLDWNRNFNGDVIAIVTSESNIPEDLNGDGDTNDRIVRYIMEVTIVEASVDIEPDTLNLKSKGRWITCYIELPEEYDVSEMDAPTILLENSIPAETQPTAIGDYDSDGLPDIMVKFDRGDLEDMLSPGILNLKVSGQLTNGSSFEGYSDSIRVINPP